MRILLLYHTRTGHTLEAIQAVDAGLRAAGAEGRVVLAASFDVSCLQHSEGMIVGSPCWAGSLGLSGLARPIETALGHLPRGCLLGRRGGGIAVHSRFGGERTVITIGRRLGELGCEDYRGGHAVRAGAPFSWWKGPAVREEDLRRLKAYGRGFVE